MPHFLSGIQVSVMGVDFGSQCDMGCQCGDVEDESEGDDDICPEDHDSDYHPVDEAVLEYVTACMNDAICFSTPFCFNTVFT